MCITKERIVEIYYNNEIESTLRILKLDKETLYKYLKMFAIPMKKEKRKGTATNTNKIANFNTEFYLRHGFYPSNKIIAKRLKISKKLVADILSFDHCRELNHKNIFDAVNVELHRDFIDIINVFAKKEGLTFSEAVKSWSYNYINRGIL